MTRNLRVGVCSLRTEPFWREVEEAIHQRAQGLPLELIPVCADDSNGLLLDVELVRGVDELFALELDALIGWWWPQEGIGQVLRSGLPVVHLSETSICHPLSISPKGLHGVGQMLATYLAGRLVKQGRVLVVGGLTPGYLYDDGRSRLAGLVEALQNYSDVTLDHIPSSWNSTEASEEIRIATQGRQGPYDAVVGLSDALALATSKIGRSLGLVDQHTLIMGINGDPQALTAIATGDMHATATLFPEEIGACALDLACQAALRRPFRSHFDVRSGLVTRENLSDIMAQKLVSISRLYGWLSHVYQRQQQQRLNQLEACLDIITQIRSMLDSHQQLRAIADRIGNKYGYHRARIYLWGEEEQRLHLVHPGCLGSPDTWYRLVGGASPSPAEPVFGPAGLAASTPDQAAGVEAGSLIIANGLGWVGEWYDMTGDASNYVIDQIASWATPASKAFAQAFEARYGIQPSPSTAGLSYDYANMFIQIARQVYRETAELSSATLAEFMRHRLQTGEWSYTGGQIMEEYRYSPQTLPDPMVGPGYFTFPVVEYLEGEGMILFPTEWSERKVSSVAADRVAEVEETLQTKGDESVFRLGVLGPFSGRSACTGVEMRGAVTMALEAVNYRIGHYRIEVVWIDSQSDPDKAARAYEEAIVRQGIQAGILNWHTAEAVPCMEVAATYKIPHFFGLGGGSAVNEIWGSDPDRYFYWLKGWPEPPKLTAGYVQAAEDAIAKGLWQPEAKRAAIWGDETDWSRSFAKGLKEQLTAAGWEIVAESYFTLDQTDFFSLLSEINATKPTLVAGTTMNPAALSSIVRQAGELGLERMFAWSPANQPSIPLDESGVLGQALLRNEPIYLPHGHQDLRSADSSLPSATNSRLVLPIRHQERVLGLLDLRSHRVTWHTRLELMELRALADQLGTAMWDAQLFGRAVHAKEIAEQSDQLKTQLLAGVSHELRTPLNVILGYVGRALESLTTHQAQLPGALLDDLQQIQRTAGHLLGLTDDLLDLSRAQAHQLEMSPRLLDPRPLLLEIFKAMRDVTTSTATIWQLDLPERLPMIRADPGRLRQILLNLLSNAERFTAQGQIVLGCDVAPPHLHIWVQDTGQGIPVERQEEIFEPFVTDRCPDHRRRGGTGLGLAIVRQLVALHNGFIALDSRVGEGSTFHVYLPLPNLLDTSTVSPSLVRADRPVLLLVSSAQLEQPARELVEFCNRQGLEIRPLQVTDALDELLAEFQPSALAWDLTSSDASQRVLVERLRVYPSLCRLPFIVYQQRQDETGEMATGLTSFLTKPVDARTLLEALGAMHPPSATGPILVVEDDPEARSFYTSLVAQKFPGYSIRTAENGEAALKLMTREVPSLLLLDLIMPGMDGFQVVERMRASEKTSRVPIVIMTGHLLSNDDISRLEQYAFVTVHSKGILSDDEIAVALHRSLFGMDILPPHTSALVKRATAYFHQHYAQSLSRREVASAIGVSENYLSQIFHKELSLSPWDYLTRYRIRQAERLLRCTTLSITAISLRVGFQDSGYFGRVFRKERGMSPSAFRASPPATE